MAMQRWTSVVPVMLFLDGDSLARCARVCRLWRDLASSPRLWQAACEPYLVRQTPLLRTGIAAEPFLNCRGWKRAYLWFAHWSKCWGHVTRLTECVDKLVQASSGCDAVTSLGHQFNCRGGDENVQNKLHRSLMCGLLLHGGDCSPDEVLYHGLDDSLTTSCQASPEAAVWLLDQGERTEGVRVGGWGVSTRH